MGLREDGRGIADEVTRIVDDAQTAWDVADKTGTIPDPAARSEIGSIKNYMDQVRDILDRLREPDAPPPVPTVNFPPAGFYPNQRYGNATRQWGNLTIPPSPRGLLVQVHGGGWMQGDPNVALDPIKHPMSSAATYDGLLNAAGPEAAGFFGLRQMASFAASRWNVVVWEPAYTYSSGNPDACLHDVELSIQWALERMRQWGGANMPVVYAGHSAGGQLALRAALDPTMPAPLAFLGMAAAGLTVHSISNLTGAPGGFAPGGTGWIFQTAWGPAANWPKYAPDTYLGKRQGKFPIYLEQGNRNGSDDGSVLVRWARDFVPVAQREGWPIVYHEQQGVDHFGVRWDQSPTTMMDMDEIWKNV